VEFDERTAIANVEAVRPGMKILKVSSKSGVGIDEYLQHLVQLAEMKSSAQVESKP
jgi:Ni2+-binding GTPase involved in maturation of urease and hydrogenase